MQIIKGHLQSSENTQCFAVKKRHGDRVRRCQEFHESCQSYPRSLNMLTLFCFSFNLCGLMFLLLLLAIQSTSGDELINEINVKEQLVKNLANRAAILHRTRCGTALSLCACSNWECSNGFSRKGSSNEGLIPLECSHALGDNESVCKDSKGFLLDYEASAVRVPPDTAPLDKPMKEKMCAFKDLDIVFKSNRNALGHDLWQYFGSSNGMHRSYPGRARQHTPSDSIDDIQRTCRAYDPRLRPWFISAATGPKDIVILVDTSGSMATSASSTSPIQRIGLLRQALLRLIETFTFTDFISIVKFSTTAEILGGETGLVRADAAHLDSLKNAIRTSLNPDASTNFEAGLTKAFDIFDRAMDDAGNSDRTSTSNCEKVVLFLTDGERTRGGEPQAIIDTRQQSLENHVNCAAGAKCRASIFTFTMGTSISQQAKVDMKRIACRHNGVWASIQDGDDPLDSMKSYFQFLALGGETGTVAWTTPYIDDGGLGMLTTAASPVYDINGLLVGVAGVDVLMSDLNRVADSNRVLDALITKSNTCRNITLGSCQLQRLRLATSSEAVCPTSSDHGTNVAIETCTDSDTLVTVMDCASEADDTALCSIDPSRASEPFEEMFCCDGGNNGLGAIGSTFVSLGVMLVFGCVCIRFCRRSCCKKPPPKPPQQLQPQSQPQPSAPPISFQQPIVQPTIMQNPPDYNSPSYQSPPYSP